METTRRQYTAEFKRDAVALVLEHGYAMTVAAQLGDHGQTALALEARTAATLGRRLSRPGASNTRASRIAPITRGQSAAADGARHLKKSDGLLRHPQHLRYPFIHRERQTYPVQLLCAVLQVSSSGYDRFIQRGGGWAQADLALITQVQQLHQASHRTYGSRRLSQALQQAGHAIGRYRTRTLMRQAKLKPKRMWRCSQTTDSRHALPIAPNGIVNLTQV